MKNKILSISLISIFLSLHICTTGQSVAINTDASLADPSAILDVKSSSKGMLVPRMTSAERTGILDPAVGLLVYDNETASFWYYKTVGWTELVGGGNGTNYWNENGTNIYNNNTGNVGIGLPIPLSKLHVAGNVKIDGANTIELGAGIVGKDVNAGKIAYQAFGSNNALDIIGAGTLGSNRKITFWNEGGAEFRGSVKVILTNTIEFGALIPGKESSAGKIGYATFGANDALDIVGAGTTGTNRKITFWNEGGAQFRGNVGIATNNPSEALTVQTLNNSNGISHRGEGGNVIMTRIGGTSAGIGTFSPTNMRIFCNSISRIFINETTGNVGIGTDNPTYKLSVLGNIRSTEVVVETGWADYVFENKYKLLPLDDLEKFIQQHKHLPNIPSAKEVEEKGLHLGDTQKRMMEKIEELTLYIIEQNKRIAILEKNIPDPTKQ